ncbi:MAG: hypothetical protein HQK84_01465 [Nitrospinae bacterium]|nr:hypothetical protein [Nitrospinota bacterium]
MVGKKRQNKDGISLAISILLFLSVTLFIAGIFFSWKSVPQFVDVYDLFYHNPNKVPPIISKKWESLFFYSMVTSLIFSITAIGLKSLRHKRPSDHYPATAVVLIVIITLSLYFS